MSKSRVAASLALLASGFAVSLISAGCAAHVTYYDDPYYHDRHRWDNVEITYYHRYWDERHQPYREYNTLNREEQNNYWKWRHEHGDHH
jgi:hypothetical protein